jgi:predicted nucleic acid-binding protein
LYLLSADTRKARRAEELIASCGVISVQILDEFVAVARASMRWKLTKSERDIVDGSRTLRSEAGCYRDA